MRRFLGRRLLLAVPTLLGLSLLIFTLVSLAPGDPAEAFAARTAPSGEATPQQVARARHELGLDRPFLVQYGSWLAGAVHGDLGTSFSRRTPVQDEIVARLPATAELAGAAFTVALCAAIPLGVIAAMFRGRSADHALRVAALMGASTPGFFLAYLLIIGFAVRLGVLPVAGRQGLASLVLPAAALAVGPTAIVSRLLRTSLLDVMGEDYIRTARAKGLGELRVILRHGLRSAAVPVVTVLGSVFGGLIEGAVIAEVIFAWPGLGRLTFEAITQRDYPLIQGVVLFGGVVYVVVNLLVDLSYAVLDPRISVGEAI